LEPTFFATPSQFRARLDRHHDAVRELWDGLHKKGSGRPSITWPEAVDEATRRKRLATLIDDSAHGRAIAPLTRRSGTP
jgi:hypothetical protein